jgi:hypothetical protein
MITKIENRKIKHQPNTKMLKKMIKKIKTDKLVRHANQLSQPNH